jgi:hypothetical protein
MAKKLDGQLCSRGGVVVVVDAVARSALVGHGSPMWAVMDWRMLMRFAEEEAALQGLERMYGNSCCAACGERGKGPSVDGTSSTRRFVDGAD